MASIYERLSALAEPIRVRLLRLAAREELGVGELARIVQLPQSTVSRHLKVLHQDGWVERRRAGTANLFRVAVDLDDESARLMELVLPAVAADPESRDDDARLVNVLASRMTDSQTFFGRVADHWEALRRDLFGDGFWLPTLLALMPEELVVADLGCGPGAALAALAPSVGRVIGVDREEVMLQVAARRTEALTNVELRLGSLEDPPLADGEVDVALCMLVMHHLEDLSAFFDGVARALRPGGRFVLLDMQAHGREEYRRTMGHVHLGFAAEQIEALAAAAGLELRRFTPLPVERDTAGPPLFVAVLIRA